MWINQIAFEVFIENFLFSVMQVNIAFHRKAFSFNACCTFWKYFQAVVISLEVHVSPQSDVTTSKFELEITTKWKAVWGMGCHHCQNYCLSWLYLCNYYFGRLPLCLSVLSFFFFLSLFCVHNHYFLVVFILHSFDYLQFSIIWPFSYLFTIFLLFDIFCHYLTSFVICNLSSLPRQDRLVLLIY